MHSSEFGDPDIFVHFKNFDWAKYGLQTPSPSMYSLFCSVEKVVQINTESCVNGHSGRVALHSDYLLLYLTVVTLL